MSSAAGLQDHLAARIRAEGPLGVDSYMAEALFHPRWGYYATRDPLGAAGDFITAPEVSQVFGELIGLWCADLWRRMGAPDPVILAELGPGRGTLMVDALRAVRVAPDFAGALRLHLVERSPMLRAVQAETLAAAAPVWHDDVATLPPGPLLLIANEFVDALPVRQFVRGEQAWHERRIGLEGGTLGFVVDPAPAMTALPAAAAGSVCETRPAAELLARALGTRLAESVGAALVIDYGYCPSACGDTLQAVKRHRPHGVLDAPGTADLTAHVDFAAFAAAAAAAGARVWGPVTQGDFLLALGLEARAAALCAQASAAQQAAIRGACRRLVEPAAMGRLFKVLALTHRSCPPLAGFTVTAP